MTLPIQVNSILSIDLTVSTSHWQGDNPFTPADPARDRILLPTATMLSLFTRPGGPRDYQNYPELRFSEDASAYLGYPIYVEFGGQSHIGYLVDDRNVSSMNNTRFELVPFQGQGVDPLWVDSPITHDDVSAYVITNPGRVDSDGVTQAEVPLPISLLIPNIVPIATVETHRYVTRVVSRENELEQRDVDGNVVVPAVDRMIVVVQGGSTVVATALIILGQTTMIQDRAYRTVRYTLLEQGQVLLELEG